MRNHLFLQHATKLSFKNLAITIRYHNFLQAIATTVVRFGRSSRGNSTCRTFGKNCTLDMALENCARHNTLLHTYVQYFFIVATFFPAHGKTVIGHRNPSCHPFAGTEFSLHRRQRKSKSNSYCEVQTYPKTGTRFRGATRFFPESLFHNSEAKNPGIAACPER
jgi:hypothetical protein